MTSSDNPYAPIQLQVTYLLNIKHITSITCSTSFPSRSLLHSNARLLHSNYIVDLYFEQPIKDGHAASKAILDIEGVVDHGLFMDMVDVCIIAGKTGVEVRERPHPKKK